MVMFSILMVMYLPYGYIIYMYTLFIPSPRLNTSSHRTNHPFILHFCDVGLKAPSCGSMQP